MILEASHTHLYPGNQGNISGLTLVSDLQTNGDCLVEFSDGSAATARISKSGSDWQLCTDAYRTAAGTDIAEKCWLVCLQEDGGHVKFRILKKGKYGSENNLR